MTELDAHIKRVAQHLNDELSRHLQVSTKNVLENVKDLVMNITKNVLADFSRADEQQYIDFVVESVDNDDNIAVKPRNLYTLLLLKGYYTPYELVKDKTEHRVEVGTFKLIDGESLQLNLKTQTRNVKAGRR